MSTSFTRICNVFTLQMFKQLDLLIDPDTSFGSGVFMPELEEPEYCNAKSTSLWELHLLKVN